MKYPKGFAEVPGSRKIAVRFPEALFRDIIAKAKAERPQKGFNEMVVSLVKCGKLCLDESDKHELENVQ